MTTFTLQRLLKWAMAIATAVMATTLLLCSAAPYAHAQASTAGPAQAATAAPVVTALDVAASDTEESDDDDDDSDVSNPSHQHSHRGGHDNELVNIGHDSTLASGQRADSVVSVFGSSTSDGDAGEVVSVFGNTRITGTVDDSAVAVLGNTYINGKIGGDAVAVIGNVELGPNAQVDGDVVTVGGTVQRDPAAVVHGGVRSVFTGGVGEITWLHTWVQQCLMYGRPLALHSGLGWAWVLAFAFLAIYVCLALLFRDSLTRCIDTIETQPGQCTLAAVLTMLLSPVLVVLLCVTVIGIAAVPFVMAALLCASLFGKAVILGWLGRRVVAGRAAGTLRHPVWWVLIGGALALLLYIVPVLGFLVYKLLGLLGLGAVIYTMISALRARRTAAPGPAPSSGPGMAPSSGPGIAPGPAATDTRADAFATAAAFAAAPDPSPAVAAGSSAFAVAEAALPHAGFWRRMAALLIDVLLIGFLMGLLHHSSRLELLGLAAYGAIMWKLRGSTIGGLVLDLKVVRVDGREIDWPTAIVRALSCFLSLAVAGLGFFWIAFDDAGQAWHDKIAGTVVVRVPKGVPLV